MKNIIFASLLLLFCSFVYAQPEEPINKIDADTIAGNTKISFGYGNMQSLIGFKRSMSGTQLLHGGGIGLILTLSKYVDAELAYYVFYSKNNTSNFGRIIDSGIRLKLIVGNSVPYLGLAASGAFIKEDERGGPEYSFLIFPIGFTHKVIDDLSLDFSSRFYFRIGDVNNADFERVVLRLGMIYDF